MKFIIVDCGSNKVTEICDSFERNQVRTERILLVQANEYNFDQIDAVVISGGPRLFTDPLQYELLMAQFEFIKSLKKPTLGICLGHQAIGLIFGSRIFLGEAKRSEERIQRIRSHRLLADLDDPFMVAEDHCEGISLPAGFELLASSEHYEVEAMACDRKGFYGVQFHPEVSPQSGQTLLYNFCNIVRERIS